MHVVGQKRRIRGLGNHVHHVITMCPDHSVVGFQRVSDPCRRTGQEDMTDLLRPHIVVGHICVAIVGAQAFDNGNAPSGFFHDFTVQGTHRSFARVDAAAGKLKFQTCDRRILGRHQRRSPAQDKGIRPGASDIALSLLGHGAVVLHHVALRSGLFVGRIRAYVHPSDKRKVCAMTVASKIAWDDMILPFQLDSCDIRGRVVRLDRTLDQILSQHDYPAPVQALVAEAALLTAMIGQTIKLRWKLSLQIRGDGPIRLIATDYFGPNAEGEAAQMRAYASFDEERLATHAGTPFKGIGRGMFAILIDQGQGMEPYQGITPLAGGSLAQCATTYFAQSEQLPTRFALGSAMSIEPGEDGGWRGGGVMLQTMPKAPVRDAVGEGPDQLMRDTDVLDGDEAEDWTRATLHLDTIELTELVGPHVSPDTLLHRLYHEESPRVFDPQAVRFGCTCSEDKVRNTMSIYSAKDIAKMTTEEGILTADCQFCGAHYEMDPLSLGFEAEK